MPINENDGKGVREVDLHAPKSPHTRRHGSVKGGGFRVLSPAQWRVSAVVPE